MPPTALSSSTLSSSTSVVKTVSHGSGGGRHQHQHNQHKNHSSSSSSSWLSYNKQKPRSSFAFLQFLSLIVLGMALGRLLQAPDIMMYGIDGNIRRNQQLIINPLMISELVESSSGSGSGGSHNSGSGNSRSIQGVIPGSNALHPQERYKFRTKPMTKERLASLRGPDGPKFNVLVTGAAGFVGMHTVLELQRLGMTPIGYDNVNSYYATALKESRIEQLHQHNITFVKGDVCDVETLQQTIQQHKVTRVIHLAAQAGVRYSLDHPLEYTRNNIDCTVKLLETIVALDMTQETLVYASSSSVYGNNQKVPFHETDPVEDPASLYAATKRSNELIARTYFNLYNISSIGLRFFTVYGPYGRPDMAPWIFTDKISNNETIPVFNHGNSKRDFTYIDDVVQGVVNSLFINTGQPEVINLGNGRPVVLADFVGIVEQQLGIQAQIHHMPMQQGDVPVTFADISKAKYLLSYNPTTTVESGIENFVAWFQEHKAWRYRMRKSKPVTLS